MLAQLEIRNLALLESASLSMEEGLTVFTGETGAGKSLLIHALDLLSGGRGNRNMIRHGEDEASVEGLFIGIDDVFPEDVRRDIWGPDELPEELVLRREIQRQGRNLCRLNGRLINRQTLHRICACLMSIQSQRDQSQLYDESFHLRFLDRFGGSAVETPLAAYHVCLNHVRDLAKKRKSLGGNPRLREREAELLRSELNDLEALAIKPQEDERLGRHAKRLRSRVRIQESLQSYINSLRGAEDADGILAILEQHAAAMQELAALDPFFGETASRSYEISENLRDLLGGLDSRLSVEEAPDGLLEKVEARLDKLAEAKRRYGPTLDDVRAHEEETRARLRQLEANESDVRELDTELAAASRRLDVCAHALTSARTAEAARLELAVRKELQDLGMPKVRFCVEIQPSKQYGRDGRDALRFLIQANPGEALAPLSQIASGGESSRILLAIRSILSEHRSGDCLVFDEVDSGISGESSRLVAEKLKRLSTKHQVICVSHSAPSAALADHHVRIRKAVEAGRTRTEVSVLNPEGRRQELARLLSGQAEDPSSLKLAGEMLAAGGGEA